MKQKLSCMVRRLAYLYLLVSAFLYLLVEAAQVMREWHSDAALTYVDYLLLAKIAVALLVSYMAVSGLMRHAVCRRLVAPVRSSTGSADPVSSERPDVGSAFVVRRSELRWHSPLVGLIFAVIFLSIPVVLVALGTSGGIVGFKLNEWLLVGLAEIPIACGLLCVVNRVCRL